MLAPSLFLIDDTKVRQVVSSAKDKKGGLLNALFKKRTNLILILRPFSVYLNEIALKSHI